MWKLVYEIGRARPIFEEITRPGEQGFTPWKIFTTTPQQSPSISLLFLHNSACLSSLYPLTFKSFVFQKFPGFWIPIPKIHVVKVKYWEFLITAKNFWSLVFVLLVSSDSQFLWTTYTYSSTGLSGVTPYYSLENSTKLSRIAETKLSILGS